MAFDPDAPVVDVAAEAAVAPLVDADLQPTIDVQITQEIMDKAAELGTAQAMYEFVRNECEFQPYYGSQKGSVETLRQRAGNDYDLASLLIALLRASGIPARYGEGVVEMPAAQATSWLAVDDGQVAGSILFTNGMEGVSIVNSTTSCCLSNATPGCDNAAIEACVCALDSYCCNTAWDQFCVDEVDSFGCAMCNDFLQVVAVRARRIWVEAFVARGFGSPAWVPLDPALKGSDASDLGLDIPEEMGLDPRAFMEEYFDPASPSVTLPRPETPVELLEQDVADYLAVNHPGVTLDDVMRTRAIAKETLGILPASLPYTVRSRIGEFSAIPAARRYQIRFHLYRGATNLIDQTVNLPEVAGRKITISYVGATAADQATIDSYNGLLFTPPNLIAIRPLLKVGGQVAATGAAAVGAGVTHNSDMHFLAPVNGSGLPTNVVPAIFNTITAGELEAIGLSVHGATNPLALPADPNDVEGFIGQERFAKAMGYLDRTLLADDELGSLMHARVVHDVDDAIVKDDIVVAKDGSGNPIDWEWRGLTVDADRSIIGVWKVDEYQGGCGGEGRDLLVLGGAEGSLNESRLFEDDYSQEAVSTIKILQLASDQGITVYKRWSTLPLPANTLPSSVRTALQNAILAGHEVTFPAASITHLNWTGAGYIDMDPCNGAAGYIIAGGLNGGSTVDSWFDIIWVNPFKRVACVEGKVNVPAADSPDPRAVFCRTDMNRLRFEYELRAVYTDGTMGSWASRSHRSKSPSQLAPAHYNVIVGDKGVAGSDQHVRKLTIVSLEITAPLAGGNVTMMRAMATQIMATIKPADYTPHHYEWVFTGGAGGTRNTGATPNTTITMVDGDNAYTVTARAYKDASTVLCEDRKNIAVTARTGAAWSVTPAVAADNEAGFGSPPGFVVLGQERDRVSNVPTAIIIPNPAIAGQNYQDGYVRMQVMDANGPNHQYWYVSSTTLAIDRETVINRYIKAGGPLPAAGAPRNFFAEQNSLGAPCLSGAAVLTCVQNHENAGGGGGVGHFGQLRTFEAMAGNDARGLIENNFHASMEMSLITATNAELGALNTSTCGASNVSSGNCTMNISIWNVGAGAYSACTVFNNPENGGTF